MAMTTKQIVLGSMAAGSLLTLGVAGTIATVQAKDPAPLAQERPGQGGFPVGPQGGFPGGPGGQGGFPGGQGGPGGPGGFPGGGFGQGGMRMMGMGGAPATVTATEKYVYVLRGDTLMQFSVDGLKLVAKTTLPRDERQPGPGGQGDPNAPGRPGGQGRRPGNLPQ